MQAITIFKKIVDSTAIHEFLDFLNTPDQYVDDRGDVKNKLMTPATQDWPLLTLTKILDKILPEPYEIENADFVKIRIASNLHTDTDNGDQNKLYKNIIIPLETGKHASTAVFPHKWYGAKAKFTRVDLNPFSYVINDKQVNDIRDLLDCCNSSNKNSIVYNGETFENTDKFKQWLELLVEKRHNADARISDYSQVTNITNQPFPEDFRKAWLSHLPKETLHGLKIPEIVDWNVGDVITFDRQLLHSGTSCIDGYKSFLAVFTYRK